MNVSAFLHFLGIFILSAVMLKLQWLKIIVITLFFVFLFSYSLKYYFSHFHFSFDAENCCASFLHFFHKTKDTIVIVWFNFEPIFRIGYM